MVDEYEAHVEGGEPNNADVKTAPGGTVVDENAEKRENPETDGASGNTLEGNAPEGITLSEEEAAEARKEGAKEAAKESAKQTYTYLTDGNLPGEPVRTPYPGMHEIMMYEHMLALDPEEFEKRVADDSENPIPEDKVAGLLELERSGKNRTPYVEALLKRLGKDDPYEVTSAGPRWTNDITANRKAF